MYARHHTEVWDRGVRAKVQSPDSENPRVQFERVITPDDADIFDFICGPSTLGVCHELMGGGDPSVEVLPVETAMLTNPIHDYGPWKWHRDLISPITGPLEGVVSGFMQNRPSYLQWNIALYDDAVFWVVPRSHLRPTTEIEETDLATTAQMTSRYDGGRPSKTNSGPIGDAVPLSLKAGEGVVYVTNLMVELHDGLVTKSAISPAIRASHSLCVTNADSATH